ncbi:MAG: DedA family protein [Deltaproteobacteria bacterium]|nr:DedA family protein [Deltaproteobacteria bacterium]
MVIDTIDSLGYLGIVLLMFVENVFPPIPSEVIMPLAGFMVMQGKLSFAGIVAAGTVGSVLGALPLYYVGRLINERSLKELADRHGRWLTISGKDIERAKEWFDKHGSATVLLCRLVPAIRSLISIPAGIARMNLVLFLAYTTIGTTLWTSLLAYLGYFLGSNFARVGEYFDLISWVVVAAIVLIYIARVMKHE